MNEKTKSILWNIVLAIAVLIVLAWIGNGMWTMYKSMTREVAPAPAVAPTSQSQKAQTGPHAEMKLTPPTEPTLVWEMVQCFSDRTKCPVPLARIASMRRAGKTVRLCTMVDKKAECIQLPAEWRGVEANP